MGNSSPTVNCYRSTMGNVESRDKVNGDQTIMLRAR
jgi:hypothetical protein